MQRANSIARSIERIKTRPVAYQLRRWQRLGRATASLMRGARPRLRLPTEALVDLGGSFGRKPVANPLHRPHASEFAPVAPFVLIVQRLVASGDLALDGVDFFGG